MAAGEKKDEKKKKGSVQIMKKGLAILLILTLAVSAFTGCGSKAAGSTSSDSGISSEESVTDSTAADNADKTSSITIGYNKPIDVGLNPYTGFSMSAQNFSVYESLFTYGYENTYEPEIVDTYEVAEDGLSLTITIDKDIETANGYPVTASDIIWSIEQVASGNDARYVAFFDLENTEIKDDYTIVFGLNERWIDFNYDSLCHVPITSQAAYEASPDEFYSQGEGSTGAYKFESYTPGVEFVLVKNENYRGSFRQQNVDKIIVKYISESEQALIAYENNEIDFISAPAVTDLEYIGTLDGTYIEKAYENRSQMLVFNTVKEGGSPVEDVNVRKAVSYAINNEEISEFVYDGWAYPAYSIISPLLREWKDEWDDGYDNAYYNYDVDKAKELLAEAGYEDGFDLTMAYDKSEEDLALVLQQQLAQININLILEAYGEAELGTVINGNAGWDVTPSSYKVQDTILFSFYNKVNDQKANAGGWSDAEFQSLLAETFYTQDEADIQTLITQFEDADPQYNLIYRTFEFVYRTGLERKACGSDILYPGDWGYDSEEAQAWIYD